MGKLSFRNNLDFISKANNVIISCEIGVREELIAYLGKNLGTSIMHKSLYISKKQVARILNISPSTVARWSKNNDNFPKPFSLGPNKIVWDLVEIEHYINERKQIRGFHGHKPER